MSPKLRALLLGSTMVLGVSALTGTASALTQDEIVAQLTSQGYQVEEIELKDNGTYEVEAVRDGAEVELVVDADGNVLEEEVEDEADEPAAADEPEDSDDSDDSDDEEGDDDSHSDDDSGGGSGSDD